MSPRRLRTLQLLLFGLGIITLARLGYLQIVKHGHYTSLAAGEHQRKYQLPAARGQIYLRDGETKVPLALNQTLKLMYADPSIIANQADTAAKLAAVTGQPAQKYLEAMSKAKEYAVLQTRIPDDTAAKIKSLRLPGIGLINQTYRTYPEGTLASQALGFVNNDGIGQYGVEGFLDKELGGEPGLLNAKTDTNGVPIATSDNLSKAPVDGTSVVLTLDRNIQAQAEKFLKDGVDNVKADSGSVVVLDPNTGAVKAMANYPTYDPNNFAKNTDYRRFSNAIVSDGFEPGSGFKIFTMAAGLDSGKVHADTTYDDTGCIEISKHQICNAANHKDGPGTSMTNVLRDSLNTGVVFILRQLGSDPNAITSAGKKLFHSYVTDHFRFGRKTGVEQAGEAAGVINPPSSNDTNYANMTFGQGESVTVMQMAAATAAIANGGTFYRPYLVSERTKADGTIQKTAPSTVASNVISKSAAHDLTEMMKVVVQHGSGYLAATPGYNIAGKTGTAQIANPNGQGYLENQNIGTFVGFAPAESPKFVVMVRINRPKVPGFAEKTTVPVFANLTRWLLQYYAVPPTG